MPLPVSSAMMFPPKTQQHRMVTLRIQESEIGKTAAGVTLGSPETTIKHPGEKTTPRQPPKGERGAQT
jgi:hypothetical protein